MDRISDTWADFNSIEEQVFRAKCAEGAAELGEWLERKDDELHAARDRAKYRQVGKRKGTIKTRLGEVSFMRRYYRVCGENSKTKHVYLLDEAMGFDGQAGLISESLGEMIVEECMDKPFSKAAASVSHMTGQQISAMGAWNATQAYGARVEAQEDRLVELNDAGELRGELESQVLFSEADGLWLPIQSSRDKSAARSKAGKRELKIATHYSGWVETAHGRHETVGKVACAGFEEAEEFTKKQGAVLAGRYDMDSVSVRVFNGDGAAWVTGIGIDADADAIQLDPFHLNRAIMRGLPKAEASEVRRLLRKKDIGGALAYISAFASSSTDEKAAKKASDLHGYLYANRDYIIPWDERGLSLPEPPAGIVYRRLGTQEHGNFYIVGKRMKRRGASWSVSGGGRMAKLLSARVTGGYGASAGSPADAPTNPSEPPLSASRAPASDGRGSHGGVTRGVWPFEGAPITSGRKAIRRMLECKPASQLVYR